MDKIPVIRSGLMDHMANVRCALSTRAGGVSGGSFGMNLSYSVGDRKEAVDENRRRFFSNLGIEPHRVVVPKQQHTSNVEEVHAPGVYDFTDALVTSQTGLWLVVSVADCVPVFIADRERKAIAVAHAGWRGTAGSITAKAVQLMKSRYQSDSSDLVAFIGPSAGVCCYEVGNEVARQFHTSVVETRANKWYLDLKAENKRQLSECGISVERIEVSPLCTICNPETMHSYRRDKEKSGRMMGVIGMVGE